ncbi:hypothetical protein [Collinsella ihumii]|uniref:hypothetical protein n=1 Tax=Collinsella ihumii TaxID=1720204 RepID=UPI0025AB52FC|nr:hypothetical protein [Collinsella ihumii]MDN0056364.1 hypothetical protein [Collinsella ihumii]
MAVGKIQKSVLTDIANAIRAQNGGTGTYLPGEMAAAVAALDGTQAGAGTQLAAEGGTGAISDAVFDAIAGAIRGQNGSEETYTPPEMAAAILALAWDTGVKMRALLLDDGTLEFNYRDGRSTDVAGAAIAGAWEVPASGFSSYSERGWNSVRGEVARVRFDADFSQGGLQSAAWLLWGLSSATEIRGFEELSGVTSMEQMMTSCGSLESVYCSPGADFSAAATNTVMMYGCERLVGAQGYVPGNSDGAEVLNHGGEGVLTDPSADARSWYWGHLYADGELVLTADPSPEAGRAEVAGGRLCAQGRYDRIGYMPWGDERTSVTKATFSADLAAYDFINLSFMFHSFSALSEVAGLSNLPGVREARYAFANCGALEELDLSGFDASQCEDLFYCFSGCDALTTIWADAGFALPEGCSGPGMFYGCEALIGGAGTAYDFSIRDEEFCRIDGGAAAPGYLTAKTAS